MTTRFKLTLGFALVILLANAALAMVIILAVSDVSLTVTQTTGLTIFLILVLATALATLGGLFWFLRAVLKPIEQILAMCDKVIEGDLSARVGIRPPGEMGILCNTIDHMADSLAEREEELRRTAQQQIGQTEKLASIGRLAAGIAHEINNPLQGVLTFAHLLREREDREEKEKKNLDTIIRETTRVRDIVRGLLDFARPSEPMRELLDLNAVLQNTIRLVKSQKEFGTIVIVENFDDSLPVMMGDKNRLHQVFMNLAFNAVEAMPDGGTLSIASEARNGRIVVTVSDTGSGIPEENVDKIFEPFFTTKPAGKGTGLGLSVTYGTIQQHGGTVQVESVVGAGTTFTVTLPAETASKRSPRSAGKRNNSN